MTTRERRLSMQLKSQELWEQGQQELSQALQHLATPPCVDVLDESDEPLSHK